MDELGLVLDFDDAQVFYEDGVALWAVVDALLSLG